MKSKILTVLLFPAIVCSLGLVAQNVTSDEVIIIKQYQSTLQDADKIDVIPEIPEPRSEKKSFNYQIPSRDLKANFFQPNPLKPIALSKEKMERYNRSFIKVGFGLPWMPLAHLEYNERKPENLRFGLNYYHLSAASFTNRLQRFSDDKVGAYVGGYAGKTDLNLSASFQNIRNHFFAFANDTTKRKDVLRQLRSIDAKAHIKNAVSNNIKLNYYQDIRFNYFTETFGKSSEWFIAGTTKLDKQWAQKHHATFLFDIDLSEYRDSNKLWRNIFQLRPGYFFDNDDWRLGAEAGLAIDGSKVFPLLHLVAEKRLYEHAIIAFAKWDWIFHKNAFAPFALRNNFVNSSLTLINTRKSDFQAGLKGTHRSFSYNMRFHYQYLWNMPLYVNDTGDFRKFIVLYDNGHIYTFHAEAGFNRFEYLQILLALDYHHFEMRTQARAWHEPALNLSLRATYNLKDKFIFGCNLFVLAKAYARLADGSAQEIKATGDLNFSVEYLFKKYLSFFLNLNNIAHQRYQQWYGYPNIGISGVGGARFSF
ncbi:MAG: TonB-dependent receptor [Chitinophagales bacterium]|nr:hypothetical protein [Chitinophagales bacterium]MDW8273139.1 TonB-dependent receptor [Chitinophagales bacterium]